MNNDLISREALKKDIDFQYICKCCHNVNGNVCDICPITEIEKKIDNAPTVKPNDELLDYVNQSIEAEKKAMADYHDLNSEDYHKGIIYAFECMRMKLM